MTERYGEGDWSALPSEAAVIRQLRASRILVARRDSQIVGTVRLATALQALFDSSAFTPVAHALYVFEHAAGAGKFYETCGFHRVGSMQRGEMRLGLYEWLCRRG
jgi:hypothetical protein